MNVTNDDFVKAGLVGAAAVGVATAVGLGIGAYKATRGYRTPTNACLALGAGAAAVSSTALGVLTASLVWAPPLAIPCGVGCYVSYKAMQRIWQCIEKSPSQESQTISKASIHWEKYTDQLRNPAKSNQQA